MRLLLDTHLLLWALYQPARLSQSARALILAADNRATFSVASIWEIAIKSALGKLAVDVERTRNSLLQDGFEELPVLGAHAAAVAALPKLHADPFDRLLIAQAMIEPMQFLTVDEKLTGYSELVRLV